MKNVNNEWAVRACAAFLATVSTLLTAGCGLSPSRAADAAQIIQGPALHGVAMGGRQPIAGATLKLYAANAAGGYGAATTNLLPANTVTGPDGSFNITSKYTCSAGQQMYMVSLGGNTGAGVNPQAGLMAALGECTVLMSTPFINLNEVTTVGSAFALAPFMSGYAGVGSSAGNSAGLVRAFTNANKLMNVAKGLAGGPALAPGATAPAAEIYTLANVLAACVNTNGGAAPNGTSDGSICGNLFALATPTGGTAPTNTIDLAMTIAKNPALQTANEFIYSAPTSPYAPVLATAPNDWTMSINYTTGFQTPKSTAVDANGDVWVANAGANSLVHLAQSGAIVQTLTGNGLNSPSAVAIDANSNAWVTNPGVTSSGNTVSAFTGGGAVLTGSPFTVGTGPKALAFDAVGKLFVANTTSGSVTVLDASGNLVDTFTNNVTTPTALAIDPK